MASIKDAPGGRYRKYLSIRAAFDGVAADYGLRSRRNDILQLLKRRARGRLFERVTPSGHVCDAGCGPGEDAARFAARGYRVTGLDVSPRMVAVAKGRLAPWIRRGSVRVLNLAFQEAPRNAPKLAGTCDAVWCFWGANFERTLGGFARFCEFALKPRGWVVFTTANRWSAWEIAAGCVTGNWTQAFRRLQPNGVTLTFNNQRVTAYAPRLAAVLAPFTRHFSFERVEGLGTLLPIPALWRPAWHRLLPCWRLLDTVESAIGTWTPIVRLCDHALVILRKH